MRRMPSHLSSRSTKYAWQRTPFLVKRSIVLTNCSMFWTSTSLSRKKTQARRAKLSMHNFGENLKFSWFLSSTTQKKEKTCLTLSRSQSSSKEFIHLWCLRATAVSHLLTSTTAFWNRCRLALITESSHTLITAVYIVSRKWLTAKAILTDRNSKRLL